MNLSLGKLAAILLILNCGGQMRLKLHQEFEKLTIC